MEMVETFFYVLKDPRTNEIKYVGRTTRPDTRLTKHVSESKARNKSKKEQWIVSLLRKNTKPVFHIVYVLTCTQVEGKTVEKMLVKKLSKRFDILNMADNCLGAMLTGKVVHQYAKTGEYLQTFANSNQAHVSTGVKDSNILRCCQRAQGYGVKSAGGFLWSFVKYDQYPSKYIRLFGTKAVVQCTLDGDTVAVFNSARDAEKATGCSYKKISAVCNGRQKSAGGFFWKFEKC